MGRFWNAFHSGPTATEHPDIPGQEIKRTNTFASAELIETASIQTRAKNAIAILQPMEFLMPVILQRFFIVQRSLM